MIPFFLSLSSSLKSHTNDPCRFEAQLQAVRERLEQARSSKSQNSMAALSFGRIAKPLRGGATVTDNG
jgi:kinesin family member 5